MNRSSLLGWVLGKHLTLPTRPVSVQFCIQSAPKKSVLDEPFAMKSGNQEKSRQTWVRTLDWLATLSSVAALAAGILFILNGKCSQPTGLNARAPLCVGSQLSVQSWLAIVGLEFSLLGSFLLPKLTSIAISKSFTRQLLTTGVPAGRLLNSSPDAPFLAQLRGVKKALVFRYGLLVLVAAVSIIYKFSFVSVDGFGRIIVDASVVNDPDGTAYDGNYVPIGDSDIPRLYHYNEFSDAGLPPWVFSANLVDFLTGSNSSITYATNATYRFKASGERTDVIIGPKMNETRLSQVMNGTVQTCDALLYLRSSIYPVSGVEKPFIGKDFPTVSQTPYNNGIRLQVFNWNQSDTLGDDLGTFVDIISLSNGSLQAWAGRNEAFLPQPYGLTPTYDYMITINMKYCYGYITWDNSVRSFFDLHEPQDIECMDLPFDLTSWNQTRAAPYAKSLLQTTLAGQYGSGFWMESLPIIGIVQEHVVVRNDFNPLLPRNPVCSDVSSKSFAVADGIIKQARTGMTGVGIGVQVLVILAALFGMSVLVWPTIPLVTDWPAQWLYLSSSLDKAVVLEISKETSTGQNAAKSDITLFLTESHNGMGLTISEARTASNE